MRSLSPSSAHRGRWLSGLSTPLPTSPARGEVSAGRSSTIAPRAPDYTLPLAGRVGEGAVFGYVPILFYRAALEGAGTATLDWRKERKLLEFPAVKGSRNVDFGYPWLLHLSGQRWLMFYYHGEMNGPCPLWTAEVEIES